MDSTTRSNVQSWMVRLADGDRSAFEPLFEVLWPRLRAFATRLLGDPNEGADAAQEALLRVFRRASEFDRERDAMSWVLAIVAYECKSARKRAARRRESPADEGQLAVRPGSEKSPEQALLDEALLRSALETLGSLRESDVETLRIALAGGARPDVPAATFRKRVQRALERLRGAWRMKHGAF